MNLIIKTVLTILILAAAVSLLWLWFKVYFVGLYYMNAGIFLAAIVGLSPILILVVAYLLLKAISKFDLRDFI